MTIIIGARDAQRQFAELLRRVGDEKEVAIIERFGKPIAVLISIESYEQLVTDREGRFQVLDHIRNKLPEIPEVEVENDVSQAIDEVRNSEV